MRVDQGADSLSIRSDRLSEAEPLSRIEKLLLMAAAVHGLRPGSNIRYANTARVVHTALEWAGLYSEEVAGRWSADEWHPALDEVYEPLVRMTQVELRTGDFRPAERCGPALFEGSGDWGVPGDPKRPPADPRFNSCRLTGIGDQIALKLLAEHPEYGSPGEPHAPLDYLNWGRCVATAMVIDDERVGFMYRVEPIDEFDSGWRFMSGRESEEYVSDLAHQSWHDVSVIADFDQDIVAHLIAPIGSAFRRVGRSGPLVAVSDR